MPTYQYLCKNCGHELEELQAITEPPLVHCPKCGQDTLARVVGSGAGLIFKGSGFYLTDYVKNEGKKSSTEKAKGEKKPTPPAASDSAESTPASTASTDSKKARKKK